MKHGWPSWLRVLLAVIAAVLVQWPYAGWHWHSEVATGPGLLALSPTGSIVRQSSAMDLVTDYLCVRLLHRSEQGPIWRLWPQSGWNLTFALSTALLPAVVGLLTYLVLTRRFGPIIDEDFQTRCRKCDHILAGLTEPRCPECGELI